MWDCTSLHMLEVGVEKLDQPGAAWQALCVPLTALREAAGAGAEAATALPAQGGGQSYRRLANLKLQA
mgnify:CR=1 FL=1